MLDFGFSEILLTSAIALVVLGPERLPKVARQVGNWMGRARAMARQLSEQLEREVSAEEFLKEQTRTQSALPKRMAPIDYTPPGALESQPATPALESRPATSAAALEPLPAAPNLRDAPPGGQTLMQHSHAPQIAPADAAATPLNPAGSPNAINPIRVEPASDLQSAVAAEPSKPAND